METEVAEAVRMRVADVLRRGPSGDAPSRNVVLLEEIDGERRLPIWIGEFESTAIALHLEQVGLPRPGTYQLTMQLLAAAGARVAEVRITRLVEDTFFAELVVDGREGRQVVDARPSDALALAVLAGVDILAEEAVLDANAERVRQLSSEQAAGEYPEHAPQIATAAQERWVRQMELLRMQGC